ncbi:hypothetical protein ECB41_A0054 [Escherichia coli B41]|nr:hypothetical protein ECB41_A0054 [Escherichia coli B41]
MGCSFTLDSQCGRLWLYQPRRQGLIRVCGTRQAMSRDPPQRREARFAKRRCPLHPDGLLPGCRERRPRRDRGGATGTVAASQGFASGMEARQGGDSFAGSVHDSPPRQGDARKSHKQERNGKKRKKRKRKKKKNSNRHGNHRKITSEKNIPDTSQTGRVTGDASAWPASLPAGVSLPGVFARADRRPPPPALYHLFLLPCKM